MHRLNPVNPENPDSDELAHPALWIDESPITLCQRVRFQRKGVYTLSFSSRERPACAGMTVRDAEYLLDTPLVQHHSVSLSAPIAGTCQYAAVSIVNLIWELAITQLVATYIGRTGSRVC